jgi:hypothetical protein
MGRRSGHRSLTRRVQEPTEQADMDYETRLAVDTCAREALLAIQGVIIEIDNAERVASHLDTAQVSLRRVEELLRLPRPHASDPPPSAMSR